MPVEVTVELDWRGKRYRDVNRGLQAVATDFGKDFEAITPLVRSILQAYMTGVVKSVRDRTATPWPGGTSPAGAFPGTLSRRSGALYASLNPARIETSGGLLNDIVVSYTLSGIANVHERGATITPKRANYLTIPLPAALDARGVPIRPRARDWPNTFVQRSRRGNLLIFQKQPDGSIVPLYVLKKQVTIPKRLAFEEAFLAGRDFLADEIAKQVIREFFT